MTKQQTISHPDATQDADEVTPNAALYARSMLARAEYIAAYLDAGARRLPIMRGHYRQAALRNAERARRILEVGR